MRLEPRLGFASAPILGLPKPALMRSRMIGRRAVQPRGIEATAEGRERLALSCPSRAIFAAFSPLK
jgi:hypothetical protein